VSFTRSTQHDDRVEIYPIRPDLPVLESPTEAAPGSVLAGLVARVAAARTRRVALEARRAALGDLAATYQRVIAAADPDGDMVALAAATVGLPVVQRAIDALHEVSYTHSQEERVAEAALIEAWTRYRVVARYLREGVRTVDLQRDTWAPKPTMADLQAEYDRLVGGA
jgi:hypothetical protein